MIKTIERARAEKRGRAERAPSAARDHLAHAAHAGGIAETQEMFDFRGVHGIVSDIEMIRFQGSNDACERMLRSDVKYFS